jgi:hypothetical protein
MTVPVYRPECGTPRGALSHQQAGEDLCGFCALADRVAAAVAAQALPSRLWLPVTPEQAARNAAVLDAEVVAYEIDHGQHQRGRPRRRRAA